MIRNVDIGSIKNRIPILDLKKQYNILINSENPRSVRFMVLFTFVFSILYFIFPIDIIPDFFLGLGYLDDLSIYFTLREISYNAVDSNISIKSSIFKTFKSKFILGIFILVTVAIIMGFFLYFNSFS